MIRQPIICVLGHVDHGKTSLLDRIRSTATANKEAGGITQHIGASEVPIDVIEKISGELLKKLGAKINLPGLLFIDTPGHEAFTNLRKRGGSVADLAILVVDVTKNLEPQTYEAISILKDYKTPFIVAANKIDLLTGWRNANTNSFAQSIKEQQPQVVEQLESGIYNLVGKLSELGFNSERFDRVSDFQKEVIIVPISAKTGEGIAELLMYVTGLSQRFLEKNLNIEVSGPGKGSILERKEEKGLGTTIDIILYNGTLKVNDNVAFATTTGINIAKIKALLKPKPLQEMRDSSSKFYYVDEIHAASGVKISGNGLEDALPGSIIISTDAPNYESEVKSEIEEVFATEKKGVILKADTIGTIEAISKLLGDISVPISRKEIGSVNKRDVITAFSMRSMDPYSSVVLAFNVNIESDAEVEADTTGVKIISSKIIYKLIDDYKEWMESEKKNEKANAEKSLSFPGVMKVLPNHFFRISHPAVFGADVTGGRMKPGYVLMNQNGVVVGKIKEIQDQGKSIPEAKKGESFAISVEEATLGRQIKENDLLYTHLNDESISMLKYKFKHLLSEEDAVLLEKIMEIKKAANDPPQ